MLISLDARSEILLGSGYSNITSGRTSPMIYTGFDSSAFALTMSAVGVKTQIYYHSGYVVSAFVQKDVGDFWWGKIRGGLGGGLHYAKREYVDGTINQHKSDFAVGPSMRVTWEIFPFGFIGTEALYGLRNANAIMLSTQNIVSLILGVRF